MASPYMPGWVEGRVATGKAKELPSYHVSVDGWMEPSLIYVRKSHLLMLELHFDLSWVVNMSSEIYTGTLEEVGMLDCASIPGKNKNLKIKEVKNIVEP